MKSLLTYLVFILVATMCMHAQSDPCGPPSYAFSEFEFSSEEDLTSRIEKFDEKLQERKAARGTVWIFGGRKSRLDETERMKGMVTAALTRSKTSSKLDVQVAGYRNRPSFVFVVEPTFCSKYYFPEADLTVDKVEFEGFTKENTVRLDSDELHAARNGTGLTPCPPAARVIRACVQDPAVDVFVLIDRSGKTVFARAVSGHPLLRAAAVAEVKKWTFAPLKRGNNELNRSGLIKVKFIKDR